MKTIEWNEEQRKAFQDLLREFVASIDAKAQEMRQTGKTPKIPKYASCQNGLNKFLAPWGYACKISLGTGNLSSEPSIAFCRQDILGEGFVNGEKPTPKKGFYLWLAYCWKDLKKISLCIGRSIEKNGEKECQKCLAYDKIVKLDGDAYYQESYDDLEADLESITNDFLRLVNEFNQIPTACFELEPSSASH
ncbi:hypothetical protein [Helicobacter pylori]|uniref:McrBC restriction endonuclease system McrB subunit n=1 Tax=Helicobacter pylori HP260AFii TaxID=1159077 RepID=A0ABC9S9G2_HELPX|nr:hypothetical protein [Helicobacter pylori]EMH19495.1 hypothetical protein HMPREF1416_00770 [Helicobacter pylori GAM260ASi]EMH29133.1 hypothetical protein HMPREF1422_01041 [Helicobacter pylori GAM268Bii]EMH62991.1 hypothetical protein HMPREF1448_00906 [Helicobacter pylori HP260AFi]EMH66073.1 hypothetical protein HMPREF1450_01239 [Helicobacter pylori HP260ASii]EMH66335.1 hypothetical protein HMPREF1449_01019 [Helicobacter pylori HP260AFii]